MPEQQTLHLMAEYDLVVIEEISMVPGVLYNMLDYRVMQGRQLEHGVSPQNYDRRDHSFGRIPIVIHACSALRSGSVSKYVILLNCAHFEQTFL